MTHLFWESYESEISPEGYRIVQLEGEVERLKESVKWYDSHLSAVNVVFLSKRGRVVASIF